jgi:hypothetical protein
LAAYEIFLQIGNQKCYDKFSKLECGVRIKVFMFLFKISSEHSDINYQQLDTKQKPIETEYNKADKENCVKYNLNIRWVYFKSLSRDYG